MEKIYRYVVKHDGGSAPNPFGGWCSLAICKAPIRRMAQVGDWIIGLRSCQVGNVIYVMQIEERLSFCDYWNDQRFISKRPNNNPYSDNIYRPDNTGTLIWEKNSVHDDSHQDDDTRVGQWVLVGRKFWYFGDESPQIPTELMHLLHQGIGYSVHKNRRVTDPEVLKQWLSHWKRGIQGKPVDPPARLIGTIPQPNRLCGACS